MIKNYFKIAYRNIKRNRKHALLNLLGLGVALAACIIVFLVVQFESSHDRHLKNFNHIYQIVTKDVNADGEHFSGGVPFPLTKYLRQDFPQYQYAELMQHYGNQIAVRSDDATLPEKKFFENTGVFYGDPALLSMFEIKFISGNATVLKEINSIAISKSASEKYFGSAKNAVGKRLNFNNRDHDLQVKAVFEDVPDNTDFPFKVVASYENFIKEEGWPVNNWGSNTSSHQVYALLPEKANIAQLNHYLEELEKKYNKKETQRTHFLHPLADIHFDQRFGSNGDHTTSKTSLYTLSFIGFLIILMACINFINLATALAVTRSKEVGIRKVMGGTKTQLRLQVFTETALIVFLSAFIALVLASIALPYIKNIMVVQTELNLFNPGSILFLVVITVATVFLSGFYPAFVMGGFKPIEAIKNKINTTKVGSLSLRRVLVVLQFSFSQIFIIATIIAVSQMNFIKNADLGFNKESVLTITVNSDSVSQSRQIAFKNELLSRKDVKSVSYSYDAPSSDNSWQSNFAFDKMEDRDFELHLKFGDEAYLNTYGMELIAGSFYKASDTARSYVVNETFIKKLGLKKPDDALGKLLRIGGAVPKPVIGVVKDFKPQSLKEKVPPIAISPAKIFYATIGIKLNSANLSRTNNEIQTLWNKHYPEYVFIGSFLDDTINKFYEQEERLSLMYKVYALLAIFISCLGLYGLISFMVVRKTKEVGIRKVLGASIQNIVYLFSKEFTVLITIAFLLAAPAAWYMMNTWLQDFEYRIKIGPVFFLFAIAVSVLIAWLIIGYKAVQAAIANPVKSLRTE